MSPVEGTLIITPIPPLNRIHKYYLDESYDYYFNYYCFQKDEMNGTQLNFKGRRSNWHYLISKNSG